METVKSDAAIGQFRHFYRNYPTNKFIWRLKCRPLVKLNLTRGLLY